MFKQLICLTEHCVLFLLVVQPLTHFHPVSEPTDGLLPFAEQSVCHWVSSRTRWLTWEPCRSLVLRPIHHPVLITYMSYSMQKLRGKTCEISSWVVTLSDRQKVDTQGVSAKPQQFTLVGIQCPKTLYRCWMNPLASCFWTSIYHPHCVYPLSDVTQCPLYIMRSPRPSPSIAAAKLSGTTSAIILL